MGIAFPWWKFKKWIIMNVQKKYEIKKPLLLLFLKYLKNFSLFSGTFSIILKFVFFIVNINSTKTS